MNSLTFICLAFFVAVANADVTTTTEDASAASSTLASSKSTTTNDGSTKTPDEVRAAIKSQLKSLTESCKATSNVNLEQFKIAMNQQIPKTEPEKCFLECIYNGMGLVKDGSFSEKGARALAQKRFADSAEELAKANLMIETCAKEAVIKDENEKCAVGRVIRECFVKNGAKINFFPKP